MIDDVLTLLLYVIATCNMGGLSTTEYQAQLTNVVFMYGSYFFLFMNGSLCIYNVDAVKALFVRVY